MKRLQVAAAFGLNWSSLAKWWKSTMGRTNRMVQWTQSPEQCMTRVRMLLLVYSSTEGREEGSGTLRFGTPQLTCFSDVGNWASHLTSLSFSFIPCEMGIVTAPMPSQRGSWIKCNLYEKHIVRGHLRHTRVRRGRERHSRRNNQSPEQQESCFVS